VSGERFLESVEELARQALPEPVFRYLRQGARDGVSAGEAEAGWDRFRFLPRVLRDVSEVDLVTTLLGAEVRTPFAVAPTTMQRALHPEGEVATARAAAEAGALMVVSSNAGSRWSQIGATGVHWWLQLYLTASRPACLPVLESAVGAGASALVLTVDTPVVGTKYDGAARTVWDVAEEGWVRANFPRGHGSTPAEAKATDLGPHDIDWLRRATGLPVVVKGVLRPDDARRCLDAGAAAVWVSNHGGRQLDGTAATADRLAPVAAAAAGAQVYVDGGIRTGRHALAALAGGARSVFLGRLPLYALAVGGTDGVRRMFAELGDELAESLRLAGCPSVRDLSPDLLA